MDQAISIDAIAQEKPALTSLQEGLLLFVLAAIQFTNIMDFVIIMPLAPQFMREFSITPQRFSLMVSAYTLSASVTGFCSALFIDRFNRKTALLLLYIGFTIGTLLCAIAESYPFLVFARIVTGGFGGVLGAIVFAIIGDTFPIARLGTATGIVMSAFALASVVGVPFGLFLGTHFAWHAPFFFLAGLSSVVLILGVFVIPAMNSHNQARTMHPLRQLWQTVSHPNHVWAFCLMTSLMFGGFTIFPYLSLALVGNAGVAEKDLHLVYIFGGACSFIGSPLVGRFTDNYGRLRVYRITAILSLIPILIATNLPKVSLTFAVAAVAMVFLFNSGRMVAATLLVTASVLPGQRGGFMSINASIQNMAAGLAALIGGWVIGKQVGLALPHFHRVGFIAIAATMISILFAARLRPMSNNTPDATIGGTH